MKSAVAVLSVLMGAGALAGAAPTAPVSAAGSWTGWIVDAKCGAKNANPNGKQCVLACMKEGSKLVLYTAADQPLLGLDNQQLASQHVGVRVRVEGQREGTLVKVKTIEPADAQTQPQAGAHHQH